MASRKLTFGDIVRQFTADLLSDDPEAEARETTDRIREKVREGCRQELGTPLRGPRVAAGAIDDTMTDAVIEYPTVVDTEGKVIP